MDPEVERIKREIQAYEPTPELLLELVPAMPPRLASFAAYFARAFARAGRPRIAIEILRGLSLVADAAERESMSHHIEYVQREMEWLGTEMADVEAGVADPRLKADLQAALLRLSEAEREELLGQVLDRWQDHVNLGSGPPDAVAANGGDHEEAAEGEPPNLTSPDDGTEPSVEDDGKVPASGGGRAAHRPAGAPTPARRPRYVSTGFASPDRPRRPLPRSEPLQAQARYLFWLDIGRSVRGSIEQRPTEVLAEERLPAGSRLRVVVYPYDGELQLDAQALEGEFFLDDDGWFRVLRQPGAEPVDVPPMGTAGRRVPHRLYFPLATPTTIGIHRLRCNVYFRGVLVQSRVISASVGAAVAGRPALQSVLDYSLARLLTSRELAPIRQHSLSMMLNDNGDGTHQFRFLADSDAAPPIVENASFGETELADVIEKARRALRRASWGTEELYRDRVDSYRYRPGANPSLADDLVALMDRGLRIYDALVNRLAGGADAADALRERMRKPGRVEIKSHGRPAEFVPASLFYDYVAVQPFRKLRLCPQFEADRLVPGLSLEDAACFMGSCPSREAPDLVCPSGFWGFRHRLGMPVMLRPQEPPPVESLFDDRPTLGMAIFPTLDLVAEHRAKIAAAVPGWEIAVANTLEETLDLIGTRPHVTYFYCHGGSGPEGPFLRVGSRSEPGLERVLLRNANRERMKAPRTLVVINGCRTAALEPEQAMELVTAFVQNVGAMGVIGTEVTIFEELATVFGARLLARLRDGVEVGEAVRRTRLSLLKDGNPLGLVYLPFVAADARLVPST
jgi:hypothetical protein